MEHWKNCHWADFGWSAIDHWARGIIIRIPFKISVLALRCLVAQKMLKKNGLSNKFLKKKRQKRGGQEKW